MFRFVYYIFFSLFIGFQLSCSISFPDDVAFLFIPANNSDKIIKLPTTTDGNLGGVSGADAKCNAALSGSKAIVAALTRVACTTANCSTGPGEHLDWVLKPNFSYYRLDGTLIGTTNSNSIFTFPLAARWDGGGAWLYWTGLTTAWINNGSNCLNWTDNAAGPTGAYGEDIATSNVSIFSNSLSCSTSPNMYILCAGQ